MNNEQYLLLSYFVVGAASVLLALATYAMLRRSLAGVSQAIGGRLGSIFRRLFLLGILLPAMFGFFSVTFRGCGRNTYDKIVAERSYLVEKNQEQLKSTMIYTAVALLVWALLVSVGLAASVGKKIKRVA